MIVVEEGAIKMVRPRTTLFPYVGSANKVKDFFESILNVGVPPEVNADYLRQNRFTQASEYDNMLRLLMDLYLIDEDCVPTKHYRKYHRSGKREEVLGNLVRRRWISLFYTHPKAWSLSSNELKNFFTIAHTSDPLADITITYMVNTFRKLVGLCKFPEERDDVMNLIYHLESIPKYIENPMKSQDSDPDNIINLSVHQEEQFLQAIYCLKIEAYRATIVLAWTAVVDYLRRYFEIDDFQQLQMMGTQSHRYGRPRDWSIVSDYHDFEIIIDSQLVDIVGMLFKKRTDSEIRSIVNLLDTLRIRRNNCAHPSERDPLREQAVSYLSECFDVINDITPLKNMQYPDR